jgi:hypothetical protein
MADERELIARFEEMGEESVRLHVITPGFTAENQKLAIKWLQRKFEESSRRNSDAQEEQSRTARTAKTAAIVAAIAASITIPLAIISIVISTLAWFYPHH